MADAVVLALDEGTSSCRTVAVDADGRIVASHQREFTQHFPRPGWVEHDPEELWQAQLATLRSTLADCGGREIAGIGITNQRETAVVWERASGRPIANAIVWQDRRTAESMAAMERDGLGEEVAARTGLRLDPYFSATKLAWILDQVPGAMGRAQRGELAAGTIDTWLAWNLTAGRVHATDVSNASRTMVMNLATQEWDPWLLERFRIPREILPVIVNSSGVVGETDRGLLGRSIPIAGIGGDQQCALFGQGCHRAGMLKTTYGTGCFLLRHAGTTPPPPAGGLLRTVAWRIGSTTTFALEGSVFMGGAAIQWLRDGLGIIKKASDVNALAASVADPGGVVFVPAMTGLGAPHWDPNARGTLVGMTRGTTAAHIARATLEGIAMQVVDVVEAMGPRSKEAVMRVDGGACASDLLMQMQADLLGERIERPEVLETTAMGAAFLAGLAVGVWRSQDDVGALRKVNRVFDPAMDESTRRRLRERWARAVERARGWERAE